MVRRFLPLPIPRLSGTIAACYSSFSLQCSSGGTGRRAGLKIRFEVLAANRIKTQHSEIACVYRGFPHSHYALPRNQTHRIETPTDTTTDTSESAEVGNYGFYRAGAGGFLQRLCNERATAIGPLFSVCV